MQEEEIDFISIDETILKSLPKEYEKKGFSIENWIYKKTSIPQYTVRFFLIFFALILIGLAIYFSLLAYMSVSEDTIKEDFESRVINTQLR